jgi:SpoIID/LytB domain protein
MGGFRTAMAWGLAVLAILGGGMPALADPGAAEAADVQSGWQAWLASQGPSHAGGGRPELGQLQSGNPSAPVSSIRVGLRASHTHGGQTAEFDSLNYLVAKVRGGAGPFVVTDTASGQRIGSGQAGDLFTVTYDGEDFVVTAPGGVVSRVTGPVRFRGTLPESRFQVPGIVRRENRTWAGWFTPDYNGELEVARGASTPAGMVNLVNIVPLEEYLKGVVANEAPATFPREALKAQAVIARGYAVSNLGRFERQGYPFDLDDSTASQVYRGKGSEAPDGNAAVDETRGLAASYSGRIISGYYSPSAGGLTEGLEWSFAATGDPVAALPYLASRTEEPPAGPFWAGEWRFTLSRSQAEESLNASRDRAVVISGSTERIETLQGCEITMRSPTGRAVVVRCTGSEAVWSFLGWDVIRRLFPYPDQGPINSPTALESQPAAGGRLESITVTGNGWGHNVGLSQMGARTRALAGEAFGQILTFYYPGAAISSYPIDLKGPARQEFVSPTGHGVLEVRPAGILQGLAVRINGKQELAFDAGDLDTPLLQMDVSEYLQPGLNLIEYQPTGLRGQVTVQVTVTE